MAQPKWVFSPAAAAHMAKNGYDEFDMLGLLPSMLNDQNPASAVDQLDRNYQHGGGWTDFHGFALDTNHGAPALLYPGDPPMRLIASTKMRDESVMLFDGSWVAVVQPDGSKRVSRMD